MSTNDRPVDDRTGTDRLAVLGIEAVGHHGVLDFERRDGQLFKVDLALGLDTRPAALSDDLQDTVDYGSLVAQVKAAVESDPVDLIETLAERISGDTTVGHALAYCQAVEAAAGVQAPSRARWLRVVLLAVQGLATLAVLVLCAPSTDRSRR